MLLVLLRIRGTEKRQLFVCLFVAVEVSCNRRESVRELQNWKRRRRRRGRNRTGRGKKKDSGAPTDYTIQEKKKKKKKKRDRFWRKKEASSGKGMRLRQRQPLERTWKGRICASASALRI
jgi:Tfp pilus assembly protein PilP